MEKQMSAEVSNSKTESVLKAAWLIALVTIASKLIGFLRDVVVAKYYGASLVSDAYFYAYQIPALAIVILGGMGGPFHSATVSVFSKIIKNFETKPEFEIKKSFNISVCLFIFYYIFHI